MIVRPSYHLTMDLALQRNDIDLPFPMHAFVTNLVNGIAGAVGGFGGVLVNLAFRQSFLTTGSGDAAYLAFIAFYAVCVVVTWAVYLRPGVAHRV